MYAHCIFCQAHLGANEAIERFPVGRRLAFDVEKGRLWVVCRRCARWNLTPLEERWEAIEACERGFRDTRRRVSTGQIGMARLPEGLELVRIGAPQRPEFAAWRYGDQLGRRRRRAMLVTAGGLAVAGAAVASGGGFLAGVVAGSGMSFGQLAIQAYYSLYVMRGRPLAVPLRDGRRLVLGVRNGSPGLRLVRAGADGGWGLELARVADDYASRPWWRRARGVTEADAQRVVVTGEDAVDVMGRVLPRVNLMGASARRVGEAVELIERSGSAAGWLATIPWHLRDWQHAQSFGDSGLVDALPPPVRLALEMAAQEDAERRAMEGELALLEAAWRDAEEVAAIADELLLPAPVEERLRALRGARDG